MRLRMMALVAVGALSMSLGASGMALANDDPFNDARYYIAIDDAKTLALVDSGQFDINFQSDEGFSILHYAADANRLDLVKALLARGANANLRTQRDRTPWDLATAPMVKAALRGAMTPAPSASSPRPTSPGVSRSPTSPPALKRSTNDSQRKQCNAKWYADQALCSDATCKMRTYRKWQTCLKTGRYW